MQLQEENKVNNPAGAVRHEMDITVNGQAYSVSLPSRRTLLDLLREQLSLTGTKKVCDMGHCGACTVLRDGVPVLSCITLAASCEGQEIRTRWRAIARPAGIYRSRRLPVRFLHTRPADVGHGPPRPQSLAHRRGSNPLYVGQPVPVRSIQRHRRSGNACFPDGC